MPLLLLRNINLLAGLANDTCLISAFESASIYYCDSRIMSDPPRGVLVPSIRLDVPFESTSVPFVIKQFPVSPSFAMTINKSIGGFGAIFSKIGIFLCFHSC